MIYHELLQFKHLNVLIKASDDALLSVDFTNLSKISNKANHHTQIAKKELEKYFHNKDFDFSQIKLDLSSFSGFTKDVLNELKNINYAETISYKELAFRLDSKAYRAVGTALSKNPYLIILPCHRVIRSDASIGRFTSCIDNAKEFLINLEKSYHNINKIKTL